MIPSVVGSLIVIQLYCTLCESWGKVSLLVDLGEDPRGN